MKHPLQIFILSCFIIASASFSAFSQDTLRVVSTIAQMSKGNQSCYSIDIPQADLKTLQQNWIKKLQENNKVKVKEINLELLFENGVKAEIYPDTVSVYSVLIQSTDKVTLNMFLEIDSVFFSPKNDKSDLANEKVDSGIKNYLRAFAVEEYRSAVEIELEMEEKELKAFENELEKLEKDKENLKKEISGLENDIEQKEREISESDQLIAQKQEEILKHTTSMGALVLETEKESAKDKQKELDKEKKQLEKERSKAKDDISDYKSKIEKNEKLIEESEELQTSKKEEIAAQEEVVSQVKSKLAGIK